ncbi:MAG: hypothetical protein AAEJ46_05950, partial [Planctomycetota bacterium]
MSAPVPRIGDRPPSVASLTPSLLSLTIISVAHRPPGGVKLSSRKPNYLLMTMLLLFSGTGLVRSQD